MIEKIKSSLKCYNELVEKIVEQKKLSSEQKEIIFKSLEPPIDEKIIDEFEKNNNIEFPIEYKLFLTKIGNGTGKTWDDAGIGPDCGILKITFENNQCFIMGDIEINLQIPFQYIKEYNLDNWEELADKFSNWEENYEDEFKNELSQFREPTDEEYEKFIEINGENPQNEYYKKLETNGILPICGTGCGEYYFIVITGKSKGEIWIDYRDNWGGISPVLDAEGNRQKFDTWYYDWLIKEIEQLKKRF